MSHKPSKNHPWKRSGVKSEVYIWAKEQSSVTKIHDFRVGQSKKDKSTK